MKNYFFLMLITCLSSTQLIAKNYSKKEIKKVLKATNEKIHELKTISYSVSLIKKPFSNSDTFLRQGYCSLRLVPEDEAGGYHLIDYSWHSKTDSFKLIQKYDGTYVHNYSVDKDSKVSNTYYNVNKEGYGTVLGSSVTELLFQQAFDAQVFKMMYSILGKLLIKNIYMSDSIYRNIECYKLTVEAKNINSSNYARNVKNIYFIDKTTYLPIGCQATADMENMSEYIFYDINYQAINPVFEENFFKVDTTNIKITSSEIILTDKATTPTIDSNQVLTESILHAIDSQKISLNDLIGKVVVLDFWYRSCLPCLKLMPDVNRLNEKYRDKNVVVLGVNDRDSKEDVIKYLNYKNYRYVSTYKSDKSLSDQLNMQAFPTTIVIGKNGKVAHVKEGYEQDYYKVMSKIIDEELKK